VIISLRQDATSNAQILLQIIKESDIK